MPIRNPLTALLTCLCLAGLAHAWSDPILVTPDSGSSIYARMVFDYEGNLHFFFSNNRYEIFPNERYDVYHAKFAQDGTRLTEDVRLDSTYGHPSHPCPLQGREGKLHVVWENYAIPDSTAGIYYARLDINGNVEIPAIEIFVDGLSPATPRIFQDSEGNLDIVWLCNDSLLFGKIDTSGQILIPKTLIFSSDPIIIENMEACMDGLDQIHVTYRYYYGSGDAFNLGYTRLNNQGETLISYAPLTPQTPGILCSHGNIISDNQNDLHLLYLYDIYGEMLEHYRKMNQNLVTIYDIVLDTTHLSGPDIGWGDLHKDDRDNIVMGWVYNHMGTFPRYEISCYSNRGILISGPSLIPFYWPELANLAVGPNNFISFCWNNAWTGYPGTRILYSYQGNPQSINFR